MKWLKTSLSKVVGWFVEKRNKYAQKRDTCASLIASLIVRIIFAVKRFTVRDIFFLVKVPQYQVQSLRSKFNESDISRLEPKERIQLEKDLATSESNARMTIVQIIGGLVDLIGLYATFRNTEIARKISESLRRGS